jgi:putative transcriptional regulator
MNFFKDIRKKNNFTVKEVSGKLNCSQSMIYSIENGSRFPSRKLAIKMCSVYKCTLEEIFLNENNTLRGISA